MKAENNHSNIAPPFSDRRNIRVGQARVVYAEAHGAHPAGWVLPGGARTDNLDVARSCALRMNELMGPAKL
jgi:hypothetical protein